MPNFKNYNGDNIEASLKATSSANGLMSKEDKTKLDSIAAGANNYTHPAAHPPSIITQDINNRFVTDAEKASWNGKASTAVVTTKANGLMSSTDKTKLDGIATGANNYTHPTTHPPSIIVQDANNRFVTDVEKASWNDKSADIVTHIANTSNPHSVTKTQVGLSNLTNDAQVKRSEMGIASGVATLDTTGKIPSSQLPSTYPATIITEDTTHRFATDTEKSTWNNKASTAVVTTTANGLMIAADKVKLNGIATGANNYVHPTNHPASIITQDASNRFVSDAEKTKWNNGSYEYGSNSNGYYKKYGDGTLEMWGIVDISIVISNNNAAPYYSNPVTINFPITSTISCSCTAEISSAGAVWLSFVNSVDFTSSISYRLFGAVVYNPLNGRVQWTAKGRWK